LHIKSTGVASAELTIRTRYRARVVLCQPLPIAFRHLPRC